MTAPRWGLELLERVVPEDRREDILGDLEEAHQQRAERHSSLVAWALTSLEVLTVAAAFALYRLREGRRAGDGFLSLTEVRLALRLAGRQPLLMFTVVLALAAGLGTATAAFGFTRSALFGHLPFPEGDRFVVLRVFDERGRRAALDPERLRHIARDQSTLSYLGAVRGDVENVRYPDGEVEAVEIAWVTPGAFARLPYRPLLGRPLVASDGAVGATPVALLRETLWESRFGRDPSVLGRTLEVGGVPRTVVGVMAQEAEFPSSPALWLPLGEGPALGDGPRGRTVTGFGVLGEGVTLGAATAQVATLSHGYDAEHALAARETIVDRFTRPPASRLLYSLFAGLLGSLALLLAVIAANVGNLMAARISARRGELAVRVALGAGRGRLVGQLTVEVLILSAVAAGMGWIGAATFLGWVGGQVDDLPFWITFQLRVGDALFLAVLVALVTAVAGGLPALRATRAHPGSDLRRAAGGRMVDGPGPGGVLATLEMCVSVALIGAAVVTVRGFAGYVRPELDLPKDEVLTARVVITAPDSLPAGALPRVVEAARSIPGVEAAGASSSLPGLDPEAALVVVEGGAGADPRRAPLVAVTPGFLEALGAEPVSGRLIREADLLEGAPAVAVVNEPFARLFLGGRDPVGARIRVVDEDADPDAPSLWTEIVGLVSDLGMSLGDPAFAGGLYVPMDGDESVAYLTLRTEDDPAQLAQPLRRAAAQAEPAALIVNVGALDQVGSQNAVALAVLGVGLTLLGGMALLLSLVSLYALTSFTVTRRTREIGVRLVLGGTPRSIARAILGRTALSIATGAAAGALLSGLLLELREIFVFRVPSGEPWLLPLVALAMALAGVGASWVPTRRALAVPPAESLRSE